MEIIEQIGSYAGLAAVLGLAVLSALYFSQARDVKRLREWAGGAPEREAAPQPARVVAKPVPKPPVPAPGAPASPAKPGVVPKPAPPATAAAAAAGAAPAVATGPPAATPAAVRAAEGAGIEAPAEAQDPTNGADEHAVVSQDTVVHPPPAPPEDDEEGDAAVAPGDEDEAEDEADDTGEAAAPGDAPDEGEAGEDAGEPDADEDYDDDEEAAPEDYHEDYEEDDDEEEEEGEDVEDTGDEPAVAPPVPPRRPTIPIGAGASRSRGDRSSGDTLLPPYAQSRPGGPAPAKNGGAGFFSSPARAVAVVGGSLLAMAAIGFGVLQLTSDEDKGGATPAGNKAAPADDQSQDDTPKKKKAAGVNPANVRVAVLNGTTVPGLAAQIGDSIERQGFQLGTVTNFIDQQRAESVVKYAPGAEREAADVGRRLKVSQREPIDAESQGLAGDATVVVVAGADKTQ